MWMREQAREPRKHTQKKPKFNLLSPRAEHISKELREHSFEKKNGRRLVCISDDASFQFAGPWPGIELFVFIKQKDTR
jgi:hypothetical protein